MSFRVKGQRVSGIQLGAAADRVLFGFPVPTGSTLRRVKFETHMIGGEGESILQVLHWGMSAYMVRMPDPDTVVSLDGLWDRMVPKDVDLGTGTLDLDEINADTDPEFEIGTPAPAAVMFGIQDSARRLWAKRKMVSVATSRFGFVAGTPDQYQPLDFYSRNDRYNIKAEVASYLLVGFSLPDSAATTTTAENTLTEVNWVQMQFMQDVLERALMDQLGIQETGAESPWEEATNLLITLLEPAVLEDSAVANMFTVGGWTVVTRAMIEVDVPGRMVIESLGGEA